jgi:hypothetical protein
LGTDLKPVGNSNWFKESDRFDMLNLTQYPGVILNTGEVIKSCATKNGIRIKRYKTSYVGLKGLLAATRPKIPAALAINEMYAPGRHACFGLIPERIVPYNHDSLNCQFLVFGADEVTGLFGWRDFSWVTSGIVSTQSGDGTFGIRLPDGQHAVRFVGLRQQVG